MTTAVARPARQLNHVEMLYRPGERELASRVLALFGCEPLDRGGHWFTVFIDPSPDPRDYVSNVLYASEMTPAQWELEQAVEAGIGGHRQVYLDFMREQPQHSTHFGVRVAEREALDAIIQRVRAAGDDDPELRGRVRVAGVFEPDAPGAIATTMVQAFLWTDVVASGLVTLGQHIELQWHVPTAQGS